MRNAKEATPQQSLFAAASLVQRTSGPKKQAEKASGPPPKGEEVYVLSNN